MLADHGASLPPAAMLGLTASEIEALRPVLTPPVPIDDEPWRPVLDRADSSRIQPVDSKAQPHNRQASWRESIRRDRRRCSCSTMTSASGARAAILESGRFSRDFVVENGIDGRATV